MTTPQHEPAQRKFVHQLIDWKRLGCRLARYPAIKRAFPLTTLKGACERPPYYCHYMSWRLGTWGDESNFQRLEELLCCAEALPDWKHEKPLLLSADYADFWSLVWQLQVAEHLCKVGTEVSWAKSGPDLSVKVGNERWYVECYTPHKSFGLLNFLKEFLWKIDPNVRASYDLCLPLQLPTDSERNGFLDKILNRFLDPSYIADAKNAAETEYPVVLYKYKDVDRSLYIYVEGNDVEAHMPGIVPDQTGNPKSYVECVLKEAVNAKQCKNDLQNHHPNLLAVNYLLSDDFQVGKMLSHKLQSLTLPQIGPNIDALAVSTVGIDERLSREKLKVLIRSERIERSSLDQIARLCCNFGLWRLVG